MAHSRHMLRVLASLLVCTPALASEGDPKAISTATDRAFSRQKYTPVLRMMTHRMAYMREHMAQAVATRGRWSTEASNALGPAFLTCIKDTGERAYVRVACARAAVALRAPSADDAIIQAMADVDRESRYWLAESLFETATPNAIAELNRHLDDDDVMLATAARQWLAQHNARVSKRSAPKDHDGGAP